MQVEYTRKNAEQTNGKIELEFEEVLSVSVKNLENG